MAAPTRDRSAVGGTTTRIGRRYGGGRPPRDVLRPPRAPGHPVAERVAALGSRPPSPATGGRGLPQAVPPPPAGRRARREPAVLAGRLRARGGAGARAPELGPRRRGRLDADRTRPARPPRPPAGTAGGRVRHAAVGPPPPAPRC